MYVYVCVCVCVYPYYVMRWAKRDLSQHLYIITLLLVLIASIVLICE